MSEPNKHKLPHPLIATITGVVLSVMAILTGFHLFGAGTPKAAPTPPIIVIPAGVPGQQTYPPASDAAAATPAPSSTVEYGSYPPRAGYLCRASDCAVAPTATLNSARNNPVVGDERPFFCGSLNGAPVRNRIDVSPGDRVVLRAYVDNNADSSQLGSVDAVARDVNVSVLVPTGSGTALNVVGFVRSTNTEPADINDPMLLVSQHEFRVLFVPDSVMVHDAQSPDGRAVSDDIVSRSGVDFGDLAPGTGNSFFVTLTVKVEPA